MTTRVTKAERKLPRHLEAAHRSSASAQSCSDNQGPHTHQWRPFAVTEESQNLATGTEQWAHIHGHVRNWKWEAEARHPRNV